VKRIVCRTCSNSCFFSLVQPGPFRLEPLQALLADLQALLHFAGVLIDRLPAAPGLLGLFADRPVAVCENCGGIANPGTLWR
jgi:hypothetical protein